MNPRALVRSLGQLLIAAIVAALLVAGWMTWRIWDVGNRDDRPRADAVVVLGAAQYNGRPSPIFQARLDHAIDLYESGVARYLIVTGGKAEGDVTTEAASARTFAIARGVPASAILSEDRGRTTLESLHGAAAILHDRGLQTAVFVSDRTHMLRVLRIARDEGITAYGSPTATSPSDSKLDDRLRATIHEIGGLGLYFVTGETP
jgi:vancomycin permeability regulator SanA